MKLLEMTSFYPQIGFGLFLSGISVLAAGIVEIVRKNDISIHGTVTQVIFKDSFNVSRISVLVQVFLNKSKNLLKFDLL